MKKVQLLIFLLLLITTPIYAGQHVYYNGKATKVSADSLTVDKNVYTIDPACRMVIHYMERGAYHEMQASLGDLKVGNWVTVKVDGKTVREIIIEQYRK